LNKGGQGVVSPSDRLTANSPAGLATRSAEHISVN
jgi:hypothetical protein